jgi:HPr kinase/phosphorylase
MIALEVPSKPTYIHATAVMIGQAGLLIRGPSRAGKSSLALALLAEAHRLDRCGRLIGDDRISVERQDENLILRGHPAIFGKIEKRGEGILDLAWVTSAIGHYVIDLAGAGPIPTAAATTEIAGVELPLIMLPPGSSAIERANLIMNLILNIAFPAKDTQLGAGQCNAKEFIQ